jgi:xylulokinase/erythritol kinase
VSVIGLDLGTSRVKAVRFDDDWQVTDSRSESTTVLRRRPGWSEQDPNEVWQAARRVVAGVADDGVTFVAVTAQGDGCWLVDDAGDPVRPAMLWNDNRSAPFIAEWDADGTLDSAFRHHGCDGAPGLAHAQLRWLAQNEPASLGRAATLLSCGSWIYQQLTGERVLHVSDVHNPFGDALTGGDGSELWDLYGLSKYRGLLPPVVAGAQSIHPLRDDASAELSLPAGTPVALAPYDVVSSAIGVGAVRPGDAVGILGTTMCVGPVTADPRLDRPRSGMTLPIGEPDRWLIAYATLAGTEVLDWMSDLLGLAGAAELTALAGSSTSGDLPLLLPYLSPAGERAPFLDPTARGALAGLNLRHSRADVARATVDGLTLAVVDCLRAAGTAGTLSLAGGGARSELWSQTISDATGLPVACPDTDETGARGAALAGAVALGRFTDLTEACNQVVRPRHVHEPDAARRTYFDDAYGRLLAARGAGATHL